MKKLMFIFFASATFAALPPLAQGIRELQTLLADQRLYESLGSGEAIKEIIRTESGYLVVTRNYELQVDLKYGGGDRRLIGPIHFELEFKEPIFYFRGNS